MKRLAWVDDTTIDCMHRERRFERDVGGYFTLVWDRGIIFGIGMNQVVTMSLVIN